MIDMNKLTEICREVYRDEAKEEKTIQAKPHHYHHYRYHHLRFRKSQPYRYYQDRCDDDDDADVDEVDEEVGVGVVAGPRWDEFADWTNGGDAAAVGTAGYWDWGSDQYSLP